MKFNEWTPRKGYLPALSIRQPWCWLILHAGKDIENRDWKTNYRGPLLIHAGKQMDRDFSWGRFDVEAYHMPLTKDYPLGGIVGIATLVEVVTSSTSPWFSGRYGFVLRDARVLPFTACSGALGLFAVPEPQEVPTVVSQPHADERIIICVRTSSTPPTTGWKQGDECRVDGHCIGRTPGRMYDARILNATPSTGGGFHLLTTLEITASVKGFDGKSITQTWIHPEPVQSYKLKKPLLK